MVNGNNTLAIFSIILLPASTLCVCSDQQDLYPSYLKMQESASWEVAIFKAWSWRF